MFIVEKFKSTNRKREESNHYLKYSFPTIDLLVYNFLDHFLMCHSYS